MERKVHHPLKTDRELRARMKAKRIHEYGGDGTLKLESQTTKCWFEFTMPVYPVDWKFQARLPEVVAPPTVRQARSKRKSPLIRY